MSATARSFLRFFEEATGRAPYAYQVALGEATDLPAVLDVPTGAGKTHALLVSWLYGRRIAGSAPRRLVYALPMRTLVEQTRDVAEAVLERLGLRDEVAVHVVQGGEPDTRSWREDPDRDQILVGTIDMLLSRALGRGYGESRFAWPISFGLLNNDCRWVFDEVQLMGPARTTSAQLDGLRAALGTIRPTETIWASATVKSETLTTVDRPQLGHVLRLPDEDLEGVLGQRLDAVKWLRRVEDTGDVKALARTLAEHHERGSRTLVVVNRVRRAQDLYRALTGISAADVVLLHSRFREPERASVAASALADELPDEGRIVVATQVIEAGIDLSARLLATDTAPWSSVVQRLGRCNRYGERDEAFVLWLDGGALTPRTAPPYRVDDLDAARAALLELAESGSSLSPRRVGRVSVAEHREEPAVLRRRDLLDLFDTAPDLSGLDVDVSPFVRDADRRSASVVFRDVPAGDGRHLDEPRATRRELVDVPIGDLASLTAWIEDFSAGGWRPAGRRAIVPGATVLLRAAEGGYDSQLGWTGTRTGPVAVLSPVSPEPVEGFATELSNEGRSWVGLHEHLDAVGSAAAGLAALAPDFRLALTSAAALHDLGKAHEAFQRMLLSSVPNDADPPNGPGPWAKSKFRGGTHERRFFRHELASTLALLAADGVLPAGAPRPLVEYLVAAHHGRVRLSIRPAPGEEPEHEGRRRALGVCDGDALPAVLTPLGEVAPTVLSLDVMELGGGGDGDGDGESWTVRALSLRDDPALGPFRLAFLEALLRIADWRGS